MIDREKVAVMTQEAISEKKNRKGVFPAAQFYMYDYVSFQVLKGLLAGTLLFVILAACWLLYTVDEWITSYSFLQLLHLVEKILAVYGISMVVLAVILILTYSLEYIRAKRIIKVQQHNLKKLERYYDIEDRRFEDRRFEDRRFEDHRSGDRRSEDSPVDPRKSGE